MSAALCGLLGACATVTSTAASAAKQHGSAEPTSSSTSAMATTAGPGALPQTMARPTTDDPLFQSHVQELWHAVVDGDPAEAMGFFFPLSAYVQVKAISDPVHDWQTRLVPDFDAEVMADHDALGPDPARAQFTSVSVPSTAVWVAPGSEYNKGSYWRVYGSTVEYVARERAGSFVIASMISWRGEWYVVHMTTIR